MKNGREDYLYGHLFVRSFRYVLTTLDINVVLLHRETIQQDLCSLNVVVLQTCLATLVYIVQLL